ncbi:MAG: hypothetical protein HYZ47_04360 [Simkania negevensis]|nr:hypothetical protein [Simkania negevensis]
MGKFTLHAAHTNFFQKHRFLELEELLSEEEVETLKEECTHTLASRLHLSPTALLRRDQKTLYLAGRDLWRENSRIQKIIFHSHLAKLASLLTKKRPLRIVYDQLFFSPRSEQEKNFFPLFNHKNSLEQISCFQGLVCGLFLKLDFSLNESKNSPMSLIEETSSINPIPHKKGSAIFFRPDLTLSLDELFSSHPFQLLIAYGDENSLYMREDRDPLTHSLKKLGYSFGDKLKNETHPFLYQGM